MTGQEITAIVQKMFIGAQDVPAVQEQQRNSQEDDDNFQGGDRYRNIQRRVYDTINVLIALDIVHKDKNKLWYNINNEYFQVNDIQYRQL